MIQAEWSTDVSENLLEDLFRFAKERLKPLYLSFGCKNHAMFVPVEKKYFSYQNMLTKTRVIEQLTFNNIADFEEFLKKVQENPEARELMKSYEEKFHAKFPIFRILTQKV